MHKKRTVACFAVAMLLQPAARAQDVATPSAPSAPIPIAPEAPASASSNAGTELSEVVVTANKRSENVRKIAGSVTALTGKQLQDMGAQNFGDYLNTVPGVQFDQTTPQQSMISMRGITTSTIPQENQSPTGLFFEEVPLTDPLDVVLIPDFDTFDMARVEVLRGPQGALFGSGALGGAVNFVPNHTDLSGLDSRFEVQGDLGHDGRVGEYVKGMVNVPVVSDTAGFRIVAYGSHAPGYIDNLGTGTRDANDHEVAGGRVIGDWKIGSRTTLALTGMVERTHLGDQDASIQGLAPYQTSTLIPDASTGRLNVDDLRLESDLGFAKLVGIASYQYKHYEANFDILTGLLAAEGLSVSEADKLGQLVSALPTGTLEQYYHDNLHGYSGELRLVSPAAEHFEWLAGVFYSDRREQWGGGYTLSTLTPALDSLLGALTPILGSTLVNQLEQDTSVVTLIDHAKAVELAGYADLSYKFDSHWKLTVGGREYQNTVPSESVTSGLLALASYQKLSSTTNGQEKDTGFNPKASLSWSPNDDDLFYFLYSHGFSLGGNNLLPPQPGVSFPSSFGSNKLLNFELGAKTSWFKRRLYVDVTPYYIYWHNIPLQITAKGFPTDPNYLDNVGDAHSYGVESSITAKPFRHLTFTNSATWSHAILANSYDPGNNAPMVPYGTPLPGTPRWQFSNLLTYVWPMGNLQLHASALNRFVGSSLASIQAPSVRVGNYDLVGIRGGFNWKGFGAELFADNLLDRRAVTTQSYVLPPGENLQYLTHPRIVGLLLSWSPM